MSYNIKVKNGMAFNLDDPFQLQMYEHICKIPNVSSYLKRLVAMDMMGNWAPAHTTISEEPVPEVIECDDNMMLQFI
jgi:hypothetical protein